MAEEARAPAAVAAAPSVPNSKGYPALLPPSLAIPPSDNPFWYDGLDPTQLWDLHLHRAVPSKPVQPMLLQESGPPLPAKPAGHLRFVAISDTHNYHDKLPLTSELLTAAGVDVLVHGGDWSNVGEQKDVTRFTEWIRNLPVKHKVVIAGNHDVSFDEAMYLPKLRRRFQHATPVDTRQAKAKLVEGYAHEAASPSNPFPAFAPEGGVAYLEDSGISVQGVKIWGSPWQPKFYSWGFNLPVGAPLREKWARIPDGTDVLLTHGPPVGQGDMCLPAKNRAGCIDLLMEVVTRVHPRYHVFGHIHEGFGQTRTCALRPDGSQSEPIDFINASNCNEHYNKHALNPPIVFDVPLPGVQQHRHADSKDSKGSCAVH